MALPLAAGMARAFSCWHKAIHSSVRQVSPKVGIHRQPSGTRQLPPAHGQVDLHILIQLLLTQHLRDVVRDRPGA